MNKFLLIAVLPFLIQATLYCDDINQMIMPQLQHALAIMKNNIKLELKSILDALILFGKKSNNQAAQAVDCMKSIKGALAHYREEEHKAWSKGDKTWWDWFWGNNPKKVEEEIDPAIALVDKALKDLGANSNNLGYAIAATALTAAAVTIGAAAAWYTSNNASATNPSEKTQSFLNDNQLEEAFYEFTSSLRSQLYSMNDEEKVNTIQALIGISETNLSIEEISKKIDSLDKAAGNVLNASIDPKKPSINEITVNNVLHNIFPEYSPAIIITAQNKHTISTKIRSLLMDLKDITKQIERDQQIAANGYARY